MAWLSSWGLLFKSKVRGEISCNDQFFQKHEIQNQALATLNSYIMLLPYNEIERLGRPLYLKQNSLMLCLTGTCMILIWRKQSRRVHRGRACRPPVQAAAALYFQTCTHDTKGNVAIDKTQISAHYVANHFVKEIWFMMEKNVRKYFPGKGKYTKEWGDCMLFWCTSHIISASLQDMWTYDRVMY